MSILIENGLIVTNDDAGTRLDPGGVLIEEDRIAWVGPMDAAPEAARLPEVETMAVSGESEPAGTTP